MHLQHDDYGRSVPVVFRSKAQYQDKGHSVVKHCNTDAGHHGNVLRFSLSTPTDCDAPLGKGVALSCEMRLAANVDKLTEPAIIMLEEY